MHEEEEEEARILDRNRIWNVKIGTNEWYWKMCPAAGYLVVVVVAVAVSVEFPTELS